MIEGLPQQYSILQRLKYDERSTVAVALDREIGRTVIVKQIQPARIIDLTDSPEKILERRRDAVKQEARVLHKLAFSPNVPNLHLLLADEGILVLEHFEGVPLSAVIERQRTERKSHSARRRVVPLFPWDVVCRIAHSVVLALEDVHQAGYIHMDLKPDNLVLIGLSRDANEWIKDIRARSIRVAIVDFGGAQEIASAASDSQWGYTYTQGHAAPEVMSEDRGAVHPCVDIYSLGVVMFQMITGLAVHETELDPASELSRISLSKERKDDIRRLIAPAASMRVNSLKGVCDILAKHGVSRTPIHGRVKGRRTNTAIMTGAALLFSALIVIVIFQHVRSSEKPVAVDAEPAERSAGHASPGGASAEQHLGGGKRETESLDKTMVFGETESSGKRETGSSGKRETESSGKRETESSGKREAESSGTRETESSAVANDSVNGRAPAHSERETVADESEVQSTGDSRTGIERGGAIAEQVTRAGSTVAARVACQHAISAVLRDVESRCFDPGPGEHHVVVPVTIIPGGRVEAGDFQWNSGDSVRGFPTDTMIRSTRECIDSLHAPAVAEMCRDALVLKKDSSER